MNARLEEMKDRIKVVNEEKSLLQRENAVLKDVCKMNLLNNF